MHFTPAIATAILLFCNAARAAPVPQLAGEGAAANSILSDTDNGIGFGIENAEDNTAKLISSVTHNTRRQLAGEGAAADSILSDTDNGVGFGIENAEDNTANLISSVTGKSSGGSSSGGSGGANPPPPPPPKKGPKVRRQLAGEGAAADSILSDTDNGVGFGIENAEDNTANLISSVTGKSSGGSSSGGSSPPPPPPPGPKARRQLDKISNGFKAIGNAAGASAVTTPVGDAGDTIDGELTSDAANAGAQIGSTEESTLEGAGNAVPKSKRQLDKISNGFKAIGNAAGLSTVTTPVGDAGDTIDGELTSDAANAGAEIGSTEESTLEGAGNAVPKARRQLDKISNGLKAIGNAAGLSTVTTPVGDAGDTVDGELTSDAANAGAEIGSSEESTLEGIGNAVPKL